MRRSGFLLVGLFIAPLPAWAQTPATYQVPMRDGTTLATDVYLPAGAGPWPEVLRRTPYGRAYDSASINAFVTNGYAFVSQDTRGRGGSQGTFDTFRTEAADGADTIAWIASQSWSSGRVGMWGASAEGFTQLVAAAQAPPALKCIVPTVAGDDTYSEVFYPGGAFNPVMLAWAQATGETSFVTTWEQHEVLDAWWDPVRLTPASRANIQIPAYFIGGTFDLNAAQTFGAYQTEVAPSAQANQFLLLGPWTHTGVLGTVEGQVTFPANANPGLNDVVAFYGWCLNGGPRPSTPAARYYVFRLSDSGTSATGDWRSGSAWPPSSESATAYLRADGSLAFSPPASGEASVALPVDPAHPLSVPGGRTPSASSGPYDQSALDASPAVLVATTAPLTQDVDVIGNAQAQIWASSATSDVDVVVRLEEVTPGGQAMLLAEGVKRGRFVQGYDAIRPLTPGAPALFQVNLDAVAFTLTASHRLRIAVSGTDANRAAPNPDVAVPLANNPAPVSTTLTIYRDATHPSSVVLPMPAPPGVDAGVPADGGMTADAGPTPPGSPPRGCACGAAAWSVPELAMWLIVPWVLARGRRRLAQAMRKAVEAI